jgi:hypothetical protein
VLSLLEVQFSFKSHNIRCTKLKVCTVVSVRRLEVLTAVLMNVRVFLDVTPLRKDLALFSSLPPPLSRLCSWRLFLVCFRLDKDVACLRNGGKYSSSDRVSHPRRRETTIVGGVRILTSWCRSACPLRSLYVQITWELLYEARLKQEWHKIRMDYPFWRIIHGDLKNLQLQPTHFLNMFSKLRLVSAQSLGLHQAIITRASGYI